MVIFIVSKSKAAMTNGTSSLDNKRLVIVGAGLAGLAAAQKLLQNGFENIVILEAQDRVGGRVQTIDHHDFVIELVIHARTHCFPNPYIHI